jgi:hypothetical protein
MGASREVATWLGSKAVTAALLGADCVNNQLETMMKAGGDDRGWMEPKQERLKREMEWQSKIREYEERSDHEGKMQEEVTVSVHDRARRRRRLRWEQRRKRVRWKEEHDKPNEMETCRDTSQHQDEPDETINSPERQPSHSETDPPPLTFRYESSDDKCSSDDDSEDESDASDDGMPPLARRPDCGGEEEVDWGLGPPRLSNGARIDGKNKRQHKRENKITRQKLQENQEEPHYWTAYQGDFEVPERQDNPTSWKGSMCPRNLALEHPAAEKLLQYATGGCPCNSGKPWTKEQMWEAVARGPHVSALEADAIAQTGRRDSRQSQMWSV